MPSDPKYMYWINFWCGLTLVLGVLVGVFQFLQRYLFSYLGENLTLKVRKLLYASIIYKHLYWFDSKDKAPGVLSNVLSEDITLLNGLSTESSAIIAESICTLALGIAISLYFSWRMALITIAMIPVIVMGGLLSVKLTAKAKGIATLGGNGKTDSDIDYYKESNALLSDSIMNFRTVIAFGPKNISYLI